MRSRPPTWALGFLELIALLCFPIFVVVLAWVLQRADRGRTWLPWAVLAMGLLSAVVKLASGAPMFALLWRADDGISDGLAAAMVDMNGASFILTWALDAAMLAAAGGVIVSTRCLPRWLGWWALVTAPLLLATIPFAMSGPPTFLLALIWVVATSVTLVIRGERVSRFSRTPGVPAAASEGYDATPRPAEAGHLRRRVPNRFAARALALAASTSRSRGGAVVTRSSSRCREIWAISRTARSKTASFACDGFVAPLILRTYCSAAACTSSSVAGGSKLWSCLMLRHMLSPLVSATGVEWSPTVARVSRTEPERGARARAGSVPRRQGRRGRRTPGRARSLRPGHRSEGSAFRHSGARRPSLPTSPRKAPELDTGKAAASVATLARRSAARTGSRVKAAPASSSA